MLGPARGTVSRRGETTRLHGRSRHQPPQYRQPQQCLSLLFLTDHAALLIIMRSRHRRLSTSAGTSGEAPAFQRVINPLSCNEQPLWVDGQASGSGGQRDHVATAAQRLVGRGEGVSRSVPGHADGGWAAVSAGDDDGWETF